MSEINTQNCGLTVDFVLEIAMFFYGCIFFKIFQQTNVVGDVFSILIKKIN